MDRKPPLSKRFAHTAAALLTYMVWVMGVLIFLSGYMAGLAWLKSKMALSRRLRARKPPHKSSGGTNGGADPWRW
jgi:hypothetical protein